MEPVTIALICAASFGGLVILAAFVRQLFLSRDKLLNDEAQKNALTHEASELEKMREEMQNNRRFDNHYSVLSDNKDAIAYLDTKTEIIFKKKTELVDRYAQIAVKESTAIIDGESSTVRKEACNLLRKELDEEIKFYDNELKQLQERRAYLWDSQADFQEYLLSQEKARNASLDSIYERHSGVLEKIYIRHTDDSEQIAKQSIQAGTASFKSIILAPIQFLLQYFNISSGISLDQSRLEQASRDDVEEAEKDANSSVDLSSKKQNHLDAKASIDSKGKSNVSVDLKLFA